MGADMISPRMAHEKTFLRRSLETFLLRDLTEKGLKKFGHSIEMCYSNIQVRFKILHVFSLIVYIA